MATIIQTYTDADVSFNDRSLAEAQKVDLTYSSNAVDVQTMRKGFSGQSKGAAKMTCAITMALPASGPEVDPYTPCIEGEPVKVVIYRAGEVLNTEGYVSGGTEGHGSDVASSQVINLNLVYRPWVKI